MVSRSASPSPPREASLSQTLPAVRAASRLLLLLDYDGTLVPHADAPELARPDPPLLALLRALSTRAHTAVHIVSGRTAPFLETWLAGLPLYLHAEHGALSKGPQDEAWVRRKVPGPAWRELVQPVLARFADRTPGALIELKETGLAWHWRRADAERGDREARALAQHLTAVIGTLPLEVLWGDKVLEVRPREVHKGLISGPHAVRTPGKTVIAAGNDRTDEDLFEALAEAALTIVVGTRPSSAQYRVADVWELRDFLSGILS
jgi:trehalose 6-phosphate synthase/phosphatase